MSDKNDEIYLETLEEEATHVLEEVRMVAPGIQALFGFQLVAVFSDGFDKKLSKSEQELHFAAILMIVLAIGFLFAPTSFHRLSQPGKITRKLLSRDTLLISLALAFLIAGMVPDIYLLSRVIFENATLSLVFAAAVALLLLVMWFLFPFWCKNRGLLKNKSN